MILHDFFFENKFTKLLIREFFLFKCRFKRDADLNECRLKSMFTIIET